jgi:hypothetical protein
MHYGDCCCGVVEVFTWDGRCIAATVMLGFRRREKGRVFSPGVGDEVTGAKREANGAPDGAEAVHETHKSAQPIIVPRVAATGLSLS